MKRRGQRACRLATAAIALAMLSSVHASGSVSLTQSSSTSWTISNGNITAVFDPSAGDITSVQLGSGSGASANLLGTSTAELDEEFAGTPFGAGTQTFGSKVGPNNSYVDVWTSTASAGSAQNSNGTYVNPITYAFHYLVFANDPTIYCYEVLNHSATDPVTSVGQGQFLFRSNPALFPNLYQINTGPNQQRPVTVLNVPSTNSNWSTVSGQAGRTVQNAATDLTGSGIAGDFGTNFFTKYDYSIYTQFYQAETMYGSQYAVTEVDPSTDTLSGGPTKQELAWTDPGILNMEFLSDHYGIDGSGAGAFPGYAYYPTQGVATQKLYGPYGFTISSTSGTTAAAINQKVISSIPTQQAEFNSDTELASSGYINTTLRGMVQLNNVGNSAGWSSNTSNNTVVLSEPGVNFQESTQGYQYSGQLSPTGSVSIGNVVPGTYRLSIYELGQWGETRVDGVVVNANQVTLPQSVKFTPQNFSTAAPIWTIGTPNRSANEFLDGHNSSGGDIRAFYGSYDYWAQEAALGNPGKVVYYATAVGSTPATNDPNKWIANQWQKFDPGLYDAGNGTSDNYNQTAPAYVTAGGGPGTYTGLPWEIHFTTTAAQDAQGQYVVLSVGLAAAEGSLTIALNGHSETWHVENQSDPMIRSGEAGYYQFLVYQFSESDLNPVGSDNVFTLSTSQPDGDMYDALRMEITNTSAAPATTGWYDYEYITGANSQSAANDSVASTAVNNFNASSSWALTTGGSWSVGGNWANYIIPGLAGDIATFGASITSPATITLDGNRTVGGLVFNSSNSCTISPGTAGVLSFNAGSAAAVINDLAGAHIISVPVTLVSNTQVYAADLITFTAGINGSGGLTTTGPGSVVLDGANTFSGPLQVSSGTVTVGALGSVGSNLITVASNAQLNLNGAAGTTTVFSVTGTLNIAANNSTGIFNRTIGRLNLSSGGLAVLGASTSYSNRMVLVTSGLNFGGALNAWAGRLNLGDNDLIVRAGNLQDVTNQVKEGYGTPGSYWNGAAGILSSTAAVDPSHLNWVGVRQSTGGTFDGVSTSAGDILVKLTYVGDCNLDGKVDGSDYSLIDSAYVYNTTHPGYYTGWSNGDFNYDGVINGSDYTLMDNSFNTQGVQITAELASETVQATNSSAVPEPVGSSASMFAIAWMWCRRVCKKGCFSS
jgi:autotransporter-associated beta strand protein